MFPRLASHVRGLRIFNRQRISLATAGESVVIDELKLSTCNARLQCSARSQSYGLLSLTLIYRSNVDCWISIQSMETNTDDPDGQDYLDCV